MSGWLVLLEAGFEPGWQGGWVVHLMFMTAPSVQGVTGLLCSLCVLPLF